MKKKKEKKLIMPLDFTIIAVTLEKFMKEVYEKDRKQERKDTIRAVLFCSPIVIGTISYIFTQNIPLFIGGVLFTGGSTLIAMAKQYIDDEKRMKELLDFNPKVVDINEEKNPTDVLEQSLIMLETNGYFTDEFKSIISEYKEKVKTGEIEEVTEEMPRLQVVNSSIYLTKEETEEELVRAIELYYIAYKLSPLEIANKEWDIFFDTAFELFRRKSIENLYYNKMYTVIQFVLAKDLVDKSTRVDINDFIDNLSYLECESISKDEIRDLQQEIFSKLPSTAVIEFPNKNTKKGKMRKLKQ